MKKLDKVYNFMKGPSADLPMDPEHGGPILCMEYQGDQVVTGSTDHGLRVYSLKTGKQIRQLYNKQYGHTEWVTTVCYLPDNRIVSGGMDSNLCIWDPKAVKCNFIMEHTGSISKVLSDENSIVISASYDSSMRIYNMNYNSNCGILKGIHKAPITEMEWKKSLVVAGCRDGSLSLWDLNQEKAFLVQNGYHNGQISKIKFHSDGLDNNLIITTGLNDGILNIMDMRTNKKIFGSKVHLSPIFFIESNESNLIVTGSADRTLKVFDISTGFQEIMKMKATDSVLSGDLRKNLAIVGCQDGNILAYNIDTGECLYGYGVDNKGAVRIVKMIEDQSKIITAGDGAQGMILQY